MAGKDEQIKIAFKKDVEKAFRLLYDKYYNELAIKGIAILGDYSTVEDIIQNIFTKIYSEKRYQYINDFERYLKLSVQNHCINYIKKNKPELFDQLPNQAEEEKENEVVEEIKGSLSLLPPKCKEIFEKVALEEFTYESVANQKDISTNTVKTQMKIAYKILREHFNSILFSHFF